MAEPKIPEMRVGMHGNVWTVAVADQFGWTMAGTGDPLADITVDDWQPLVPVSAPRVYLPDDKVPVGTVITGKDGSPFRVPDAYVSEGLATVGVPFVEVQVLSPEQWQSAVDRALVERKATHD